MLLKKKSWLIPVKGIGWVLFERSLRAKHVNISIKPFKGVRVAIPRGISVKKAKILVEKKMNWIQKNLVKITRIEQKQKIIFKSDKTFNQDARESLKKRLSELADIYGFSYNRVFIRSQKSRWGSCSAKNNISLNLALAQLPVDLRDYVILHELVHTRVKNHSPGFWSELEKYLKNAKEYKSRLNEILPYPGE